MIYIGHKLKHAGNYVGRHTPLGNPASHKSGGPIHVPSLQIALDYYDNWIQTQIKNQYSPQSLMIDSLAEEAWLRI